MQIVSTCLARDLAVYSQTCCSLRRYIPGCEIHVITRREDFEIFRKCCGTDIFLWDESEMIPGMTLGELKKMPFSFFPKGAGWYFQQFLKFSFVDVSNDDDYFLIWDADTVLLRPLDFFSSEGLPFYTKAKENHSPYFETYRALFGRNAEREFSFISQHQIIHKATLRRMLNEIQERHPSSSGWAWAIMQNLQGCGSNLFSEYETYGHYVKSDCSNDLVLRDLPWTRDGSLIAGYPPTESALEELSHQFCFAAFEANQTRSRRFFYKVAKWFRRQ